ERTDVSGIEKRQMVAGHGEDIKAGSVGGPAVVSGPLDFVAGVPGFEQGDAAGENGGPEGLHRAPVFLADLHTAEVAVCFCGGGPGRLADLRADAAVGGDAFETTLSQTVDALGRGEFSVLCTERAQASGERKFAGCHRGIVGVEESEEVDLMPLFLE